jgi:transposase
MWQPSRLTREQMAERRRLGGRLLKAGKLSQTQIARQLGVSRVAVNQWAKMVSQDGLRGLQPRQTRGGRSKLTTEQHTRLKHIIQQGAQAAGFETERWTLERVKRVILREFHVNYHRNYLARLLRRLGISPQQPLPRATERDEALIRAWLSHDWPRIKKSAAQAANHRVSR